MVRENDPIEFFCRIQFLFKVSVKALLKEKSIEDVQRLPSNCPCLLRMRILVVKITSKHHSWPLSHVLSNIVALLPVRTANGNYFEKQRMMLQLGRTAEPNIVEALTIVFGRR
jgi:hypothetical protein